jgi:tRNA pseudouridine32 synthase/23S rRNA pseudouridine746 synthase/23S rRNA pseudouridine1911/1915/1917 synthase
VVGVPTLRGTGTIDLPLRKGRKSRYRVAGLREHIERHGDRWALSRTGADAHDSVTRLRIVAHSKDHSVVVLKPQTGRTHQLRVHLAWIGHPIQGDHLYGRPEDPAQQWPRLALHCHRIRVPGLLPTVTAPCPEVFGVGRSRRQ